MAEDERSASVRWTRTLTIGSFAPSPAGSRAERVSIVGAADPVAPAAKCSTLMF